MVTLTELFIALGVLALSSFGVAFIGYKTPVNLRNVKKEEENKIEEAKKEAEEMLKKVHANTDEVKRIAREENEQLEKQLQQTENVLQVKENILGKREARLNELKNLIENTKSEAKTLQSQIRLLRENMENELTGKAGVEREEVKETLIAEYRQDIFAQKEMRIRKYMDDVKITSQRRAQKILFEAIQRYSSATSVETKASTVKVQKDEIKGRLVGKNGEFIEYFEEIAEVDVIFNDLPKTIKVSAFDLVKRHIATRALEKLVKARSGISKEMIKKAVENAKTETEKILLEIGNKVAKTLKLGEIPEDFAHIIGRLQFRTSYGQNILKHSFEVAALATVLAYELGADIYTCKMAAFFHDLGKAIDHDSDKAHDDLTKELLEKYGFSEEIVYAAYAHHDKVPANTIPAQIVKAADAISASRPGARQESLEKYLERLHALEETASAFEGVKKTFAISAGREVRVMVDAEIVNDVGVKTLAHDIAEKVEKKLTYPGKIKINVIRKTRSIDYAQ